MQFSSAQLVSAGHDINDLQKEAWRSVNTLWINHSDYIQQSSDTQTAWSGPGCLCKDCNAGLSFTGVLYCSGVAEWQWWNGPSSGFLHILTDLIVMAPRCQSLATGAKLFYSKCSEVRTSEVTTLDLTAVTCHDSPGGVLSLVSVTNTPDTFLSGVCAWFFFCKWQIIKLNFQQLRPKQGRLKTL